MTRRWALQTCYTLRRRRRQDSVTAGARNKSWGVREVYLSEFERGAGAQEIYSSVDQTNKVKTKKKVFCFKISTNSGYRLKILSIFHEFLSEDQKKRKVFSSKISTNSGYRLKILAIFHKFFSEDQKKKLVPKVS